MPYMCVARSVRDLNHNEILYSQGLGLQVLGQLQDHKGFNSGMLDQPQAHYHYGFTQCHHHPVMPAPTTKDLLVFYESDATAWADRCEAMCAAGF